MHSVLQAMLNKMTSFKDIQFAIELEALSKLVLKLPYAPKFTNQDS